MFLLAVNQTLNNDELIKEMQEKIVALQDHEISFLNDTIANIWAAVGIGAGIIVGIAGFVGWLINRSNQKAQEKMQLAEQILGDAQIAKEELLQYKADLEVYREETRREFKELTKLVNSEEIADLKEKTQILTITSHVNHLVEEIEFILRQSRDDLALLQKAHANFDSFEEVRSLRVCENKFNFLKIQSREPSKSVEKAARRIIDLSEAKVECESAVENLKRLIRKMNPNFNRQGSTDFTNV